MAGIFLKIVNMSISACWIVLAVMLSRIILKKAPKWINCVLWGIVGLRLVMPFSFESVFSLIPSAETISKMPDSPRPHIDSGVPVIDNQVNGYLKGNYFEGVSRPTGNFVDITTILAVVWAVGILALLIYSLVSFLILKSKIGTAVLLCDNIYQSEAVVSPFVLGLIKPKIYLSFNMNEQNMEHVIAHELAHIRRKDHWWKPLGFLILTIHWFNPLIWLSYILLCRDIELACDEKVVKELDNEQRADYSEALLACSVNRRMIAACPLAFGEVGVKDRVKSVLNYKKPAFWIIIVAIVLCVGLAVGFLTNPMNVSVFNGKYETGKCLYDSLISEEKATKNNNTVFSITQNGVFYETLEDGTTYELGKLTETDYTTRDLSVTLTNQGKWLNLGRIKNAYECSNEIGTYVIFQKPNGTVYIVALFSDGSVIDVFKLKRIGDCDISNSIIEQFAWTYSPMLSHTSHFFYPFEFDFEYTHIIATCTNGMMQNLEAEGQPKASTLRFEKGQHVYWTPDEGVIEKVPSTSKISLTVYNGNNEIYSSSVIFECVARELGSADFKIYLEEANGIVLTRKEDCACFVEKAGSFISVDKAGSSISNIGGADTPDKLTISISNVLKDKYRSTKPDGLVHIESYHLLANEVASGTPKFGNAEHAEEITVYLIVYHMKYKIHEIVEEVEGDFVPTAITFSIDENGEYLLKDYWTPRAGANYANDIRAKFPGDSADDALNIEKYAEALTKDSWTQANEYLKNTIE